MVVSSFNKGIIRSAALILLLAGLILAGCGSVATKKAFYAPITAELQSGNFATAVSKIEKAKKEGRYGYKDRLVYFLDAGFAYHYAEKHDSSNIRLHAAEQAADELYTKSISRAMLSYVLNDNAQEYSGEDYEVLYGNLISALNYIALNRFDNAFVEVKRANEKLNLLELKYLEMARVLQRDQDKDTLGIKINYDVDKVRFNNSAFARYLSMHMYAADGKYDDADIDYHLLHAAFAEQPHIYDFSPPDVKFFAKDKNKVILSVVALAGMAPVKEALQLRLRTDSDLNLVQILYTDPERQGQEYSHIPMKIGDNFYFKFAIPYLLKRPSGISRIRVLVDSVEVGTLQLLEDVGAVADETFKAKRSLIYLKTIARALAKGLIAQKQKEKVDKGNVGGWLAKLAIDAVADISENADLRCARLLPGQILVGDFEIAPGTYNITIEFYNRIGNLLTTTNYKDYKVLPRGLNMVEAFALD